MQHPLYLEISDPAYWVLKRLSRKFTRAGYPVKHDALALDLLTELLERRPDLYKELCADLARRENVQLPNL